MVRTLAITLIKMRNVLQDKGRPQKKPACILCLFPIAALVTHQVLVKLGALSERNWAPTDYPRSRAWKLGKDPYE